MYKQVSNERGVVSNVIKRLSDGAFIFNEPTSSDYQAYLQWLSDGNTPEPAEEQQ